MREIRNPKSEIRRRTKHDEKGLTLLEVMIALAVFAMVAVLLLPLPAQYMRDTGRARDQRIAWTLAAHKMAEIELDPVSFQGEGGASTGDFGDQGHSDFRFDWQSSKEEVATQEETDLTGKPKEIFRVKLTVYKEEEKNPLAALEALFPAPKEEGQ